MTKYYSNKPDFSSDTPWVFGLDATAKMRDYLKDIEELGKIVQEEEVDDLYVQRGEAALGVTKESGPFKTSYDRVNTMFTSAKKIHSDIMQNIDSKFTKGMDEAFVTLDKVNGHANPYKSKNIKKDVIKSRPKPGTNGYETETYTDQESYKLSELLDGKTSPIKAAKDVYDERLGVAKQILANKDKLSAEQRKVIEGKTAEEIVEIQYPTELPSYQRLKGSTFHEENKDWLQYVDLGLQVAAIAGTVMTGGAGTPFLAASMTYAAVNSGYAWTTGKTLITGTQLTGEEQFWSGVEFFATLISGGGMIKLAKLGDGGTTLVRGIAKAATHADDFADAAQTIYAVGTSKNPEEAIFSYVGRQVFGFGIGKYADHLKMKRTNAELDIDIPSGSKNSSVNLELSNGFNKGLKVDTDGLNLNSKVKTNVNAGSGVADVDLTLAKKSADLELPVKTNLTEAGTLNGIAGAKAADMDVPKVKQVRADYNDYVAHKTSLGEEPLSMSDWKLKNNLSEQNFSNYREFSTKKIDDFKTNLNDVETKITVETRNAAGEIQRIQLKAVGVDETGKIRIQDYTTAKDGLSIKRQDILDNLSKYGGTVVGKGKGRFTGGTKIEPGTRIDVISKQTDSFTIDKVSSFDKVKQYTSELYKTDLSLEEKVQKLQKYFTELDDKVDINVPSDAQYVKSIEDGWISYDWPERLGFKKGTVRPITRTSGLPER